MIKILRYSGFRASIFVEPCQTPPISYLTLMVRVESYLHSNERAQSIAHWSLERHNDTRTEDHDRTSSAMQEPISCRFSAFMRRYIGSSNQPNGQEQGHTINGEPSQSRTSCSEQPWEETSCQCCSLKVLSFHDCSQLSSCSLERIFLHLRGLFLVNTDEDLCCITMHNMSFNARRGTMQISYAPMRRNSARSTEMLATFARGVVPCTVELFQQRSNHIAMMLSGAFMIYQTDRAVAGDVLQLTIPSLFEPHIQ